MRSKSIAVCMVLSIWILMDLYPCLATEHDSGLSCTRLTVNEQGASYFVDEQKTWNAWPSNLAMITLAEESDNVRFCKAKPGWQMLENHYAPWKQYLLVLHGTLEIQASSGETRRFRQGSVLLVEDTYGEGHRTKNSGDEDLILVWVGIAEKAK